MADVSSRAFKQGKYFHAVTNILSFFNSNFPLPQSRSWHEHKVPRKLSWRVISSLLGEQLSMESLTRLPKLGTSIGVTGAATQQNATQLPPLPTSPPLPRPSSLPVSLNRSGGALTDFEIRSKFSPLTKPWQPSPRPLNWVENVVPYVVPSCKVRENTLLPCNSSWKASVVWSQQDTSYLHIQVAHLWAVSCCTYPNIHQEAVGRSSHFQWDLVWVYM